MKGSKILDLLFNVALPLAAGTIVYLPWMQGRVPPTLRNHLPDACWAYAFMSAMLINWRRIVKVYWISAIVVSAILFEMLQFFRQLPGTGDIYDVFNYLFAFLIVLFINKTMKNKFYDSF